MGEIGDRKRKWEEKIHPKGLKVVFLYQKYFFYWNFVSGAYAFGGNNSDWSSPGRKPDNWCCPGAVEYLTKMTMAKAWLFFSILGVQTMIDNSSVTIPPEFIHPKSERFKKNQSKSWICFYHKWNMQIFAVANCSGNHFLSRFITFLSVLNFNRTTSIDDICWSDSRSLRYIWRREGRGAFMQPLCHNQTSV